MSDKYHEKAKDAGNKLKGNILSFSSVATGVFFFTLTGNDASGFSYLEKFMLLVAITFFALTVLLCLFELYIDSQRFFAIAKQMEKPEEGRD
jgi:preprotein translocase subunit SecG